jgi:hypothetical protein
MLFVLISVTDSFSESDSEESVQWSDCDESDGKVGRTPERLMLDFSRFRESLSQSTILGGNWGQLPVFSNGTSKRSDRRRRRALKLAAEWALRGSKGRTPLATSFFKPGPKEGFQVDLDWHTDSEIEEDFSDDEDGPQSAAPAVVIDAAVAPVDSFASMRRAHKHLSLTIASPPSVVSRGF